jgi:hypothetical protein
MLLMLKVAIFNGPASVVVYPAAQFLGGGLLRFCREPPDLGGERRSTGAAGFRHDFRAGYQFVQSRSGFRSVGLLRPMRARGDDQHAVLRGATAGYCEEALPHVGWERARLADIEAQLDGSGNFVDVLAARARSANKGHC